MCFARPFLVHFGPCFLKGQGLSVGRFVLRRVLVIVVIMRISLLLVLFLFVALFLLICMLCALVRKLLPQIGNVRKLLPKIGNEAGVHALRLGLIPLPRFG
jgi:hypothetical protein